METKVAEEDLTRYQGKVQKNASEIHIISN